MKKKHENNVIISGDEQQKNRIISKIDATPGCY